jgi:cysteinyl-tRNA synthetase
VAGSTGRVDVAVDANLVFEEAPPAGREAEWATWWKDRRVEAKKSRNFKLADEIRDRLKANGFEIRDTKDGSEVVRVG